jgi:CBS domain containing-hemolysin-like protein
MGLSLPTALILAAVLVLINGWFVAAEFALVRVRSTRLKQLAAEGNRTAELCLSMTARLEEYLSAIQLGITLASLALGWIGEPSMARLLRPLLGLIGLQTYAHGIAITTGFLIITFLHVVVGEQAPKVMAIQRAEAMSLIVARPLRLFFILTYPLIWVLQRSANGVIRMLGLKPRAEAEAAMTQEELQLVVASSHRQGLLDEATRDLLDNAMVYGQRIAREIMTPRRDVVAIDVKMPVMDAINLAIEKEYTRYPLVDLDTDRVLGFIHIKDLPAIVMGRRKISSLTEIARQPLIVPETQRIDRLRRHFQAGRVHFGIVIDEHGDFTGIVSLEDLLEEIFGDIQDELDREVPAFVARPDGSAELDGGLLLEKAVRKLSLRLTEEIEGVDTIGGYVFSLLGRAPVAGDSVVVGDHRLEVLQVDEMRIRRLRAVPLPKPEPADEEKA